MGYALDEADACVLCIATVEGFLSLPWEEMGPEQHRGAVLLAERLLARAKPLLRQNQDTAHVHDAIRRVEQVAARVRALDGAPPVT